MNEEQIIITKDAARNIVKFKYGGPDKGEVKTYSLGRVVTMGFYMKEIDTLIGYDDQDNIFLF